MQPMVCVMIFSSNGGMSSASAQRMQCTMLENSLSAFA
jgi:hypothetical protein